MESSELENSEPANGEALVASLLKDDSFQRWILGDASEEERRRWDEWIRERPAHREAAREAARTLRLARFTPPEEAEGVDADDLDAAWARLQAAHRRGPAQSERPQASDRSRRPAASNHRSPVSRRRRLAAGRGWRKSAATAVAVVLVALAVWQFGVFSGQVAGPGETTITTGYGERATLTLPHGTAIVLNANSRLRLSLGKEGRLARKVYLEGEAFFDVTTVGEGASRKPFLVRTADGTVRVLGTRFSVARREGRTRVVLNEGKVAIRTEREATATLRPTQLAAFGRTVDEIRVRRVNPKVYSSWTTSTLVFDDTRVAVVARRIEDTYGLEVRAREPSVLDETISGRVENDLGVLIEGLSRLLERPIHRTEEAIIFK